METVLSRDLVVPVRVPADLAAKLNGAVSKLHYASRNAFIREAIEQHVNDRLESRMLEVRDVSAKSAAKMIDRYLTKHPGAHYMSELAEELGLELNVAFKAARMLEARGTVKARSR